ncbi:unnamed protein product, partial [Prunus brigantina]
RNASEHNPKRKTAGYLYIHHLKVLLPFFQQKNEWQLQLSTFFCWLYLHEMKKMA